MKKTLLFLFLLAFPFLSQAQTWLYFSANQKACLVDSTQTTNQYDDWDIYQTTNNEWDGTLDSTFCGEVNLNDKIDLSTIGAGKTFFIRHRLNDNNKIWLNSTQLYAADLIGHLDSTNAVNFGNNCNGSFCSSIIAGIEIPDSLGTGTAMRWHETIPSVSNNTYDNFEAHFCLPTENFNNNYLREIIIKITVDNPVGELGFQHFALEDIFLSSIIQSNIDIYGNQGNYDYQIYNHDFVIRSTSMYPNSYGIEYVDLIPIPNVDTAVTMNINIDPEASLILQPFVEFQAEYLLNSTTQRHNYNIINNGGNICFPNYIEVKFNDGNHYIHKSGHVDFNGKTACMQFGEGSKLIVSDNTRFDYGINGVGNLALRSGSSIEIGEGAELHVNNNMMLFEFKYDTEPQQLYMTLNKGSKLSFGKEANISNEYSIDGLMKLNIYMKGGEVDLSQLSPESRAVINLIYDTPEVNFSNNIKVLGNPIQENIRISIINEFNTSISVNLTSVNGQTVYNEIIDVQKGYDEVEIQNLGLANGLYFITIQSNGQVFTEKVIILK